MRRKATLLFILFYLLMQAAYGIMMDFLMVFAKYSPLGVKMPLSSWWNLLLDVTRSQMKMLSIALAQWDLYKVVTWIGSGAFLVLGGWVVGSIVSRAYDGVYSRLGELENGNYAGVARERWIFSSLIKRVNALSVRLQQEDSRMKRQRREERADTGKAVNEIRALAAAIRGHAEVLSESPSIPGDGYEKQLVQQILQKTLEMEGVTAKAEEQIRFLIERDEGGEGRKNQIRTE